METGWQILLAASLEFRGILSRGEQHLPGPTLPLCSISAIHWRCSVDGGVFSAPYRLLRRTRREGLRAARSAHCSTNLY